MAAHKEHTDKYRPVSGGVATELPAPPTVMTLDLAAVDAARHGLRQGAVTPVGEPWREATLALLGDALATELVCTLRYRRHHYTAHGLSSVRIGDEFLRHARQEQAHADRLAQRIVELGGRPDFNPETLIRRSHVPYDDSTDLVEMIESDLRAERVAIEVYAQCVALVGERDPSTRRLLEDLLADEQAHAHELCGWLTH